MRRVWLITGLIMLFAVALVPAFSTWTAKPVATELEKGTVKVSVLFLDIAGYTQLSKRVDPRQLNRLVQTYFSTFLETIHAHHGHVSESAGHGLMVIFPAGPNTLDHALNATRAALVIYQQTAALNEEFREVRPPIQLHVGINTGEALVRTIKLGEPSGQRWTFKATGPTVNIAARLVAFAGPGEIVVGEATAEAIWGQFVLKDLGDKRLDNATLPLRVYRLILPGVYEKVVSARSPRGLRTAWCWWSILGTPRQGSGRIKVEDNGASSERIASYTKLPG